MNITVTSEISQAIKSNAAFAIAVSGGKDSSIAALATNEYLDSMGHKGSRILIHSDLGSVEWEDSIRICERLSERLDLPLVIVRRKAGGMMQRWSVRWQNNVRRYAGLSCVKLILPWSTPSMRFCTSELKTSIICRELVRRFRGQQIVNVTGIRREESSNRAKMPITKINNLLTRKDGTAGLDWHPIADMTTEQIFCAHKQFNFPLHEAYTRFGSSRVSCAFCIMSKQSDLLAASTAEANAQIYSEMCDLEIRSCFSFQSALWLSDIAPDLLTSDQRSGLRRAKEVMSERIKLESDIPKHLLYTPRWPECVPSWSEAVSLCKIRTRIGELQNFPVEFTDPMRLIGRYKELMNLRNAG